MGYFKVRKNQPLDACQEQRGLSVCAELYLN